MRPTLDALHAVYGPLAHPPADLFGFYVWEVISEGALPARRDLAWLALKRIPALTPDAMFRLVRHAFQHRRKMLRRSLAGVVPPDVFGTAGIDSQRRPEELTVVEWGALWRALDERRAVTP